MVQSTDDAGPIQGPSRTLTIRPVTPDDVPALKAVIDANGLFPSDMLDDMLAGYLNGGASDDCWLTVDVGGPVAVAYYVPERMTQGTWNLLLIAVHPDRQGEGRGAALLRHVEQTLAARGQRVLLVETSGLPEFERTRAFYRNLGYGEEARIRDFYQAGEDKIVFRKALGTARASASID
jgi:ribosomal protein S18 acetylase RimI-like enzyme